MRSQAGSLVLDRTTDVPVIWFVFLLHLHTVYDQHTVERYYDNPAERGFQNKAMRSFSTTRQRLAFLVEELTFQIMHPKRFHSNPSRITKR